MKFTKPEPFNGKTFSKDLSAKKIKINDFYDDGQGYLIVNSDEKNEQVIQELLSAHDGSAVPLTVSDKLEMAGLDLDELRVALGL